MHNRFEIVEWYCHLTWQTITDTLKIESCCLSSYFDPFKHNAGNWVDDRFVYWASLFRTFFSYYIMHNAYIRWFLSNKNWSSLFLSHIFRGNIFNTSSKWSGSVFMRNQTVPEIHSHWETESLQIPIINWTITSIQIPVLQCILFAFWIFLQYYQRRYNALYSTIQLVYAEHVDLTNNSCDGGKNPSG